MTVKEYLKLKGIAESSNDRLTFIIEKDGEYRTTPIHSIWEWYEGPSKCLDYILLNPEQPPIVWASNTVWADWHKRGDLLCFLVTAEEDLLLKYPQKQADSLIASIDKKIKNK